MFYFDEFPNELILIIFSYLTKFELLESFLKLNIRYNRLLSRYIHHINLSSIFTKNKINKFSNDYFPYIKNDIYSLTIDNYQIGKDVLQITKLIHLENLFRIQLIDHGIDLQQELVNRFKPEILTIVITSLNQENKQWELTSTSLKRLEIQFETGEIAKNCLLNQLGLLSPLILVDIRLSFSKLSEYFQLFINHLPIHIEKVYVSIFSIDKIDNHSSNILLPYLIDFQLEICQIPFDLIQSLLPLNNKKKLERFAFIGRTTTINAKSWRQLLEKYTSIEQFDLQLFNYKSIQLLDFEEWKFEFPKYTIEYNCFDNSFRIRSSTFDILNRITLNECIDELNHIQYTNDISHLIIRSQYWCSYVHLSINIQNKLLKGFNHIRRLSTTYRQLEYFIKTKFLNQIEQLDLEFAEKYCYIQNEIAEEFLNLKSLYLSSMYDGIHDLNLHSTIQNILLIQFSKIIYISIDAIRITDDEQVEKSISQWYPSQINQPLVNYIEGKFLSVWF